MISAILWPPGGARVYRGGTVEPLGASIRNQRLQASYRPALGQGRVPWTPSPCVLLSRQSRRRARNAARRRPSMQGHLGRPGLAHGHDGFPMAQAGGRPAGALPPRSRAQLHPINTGRSGGYSTLWQEYRSCQHACIVTHAHHAGAPGQPSGPALVMLRARPARGPRGDALLNEDTAE